MMGIRSLLLVIGLVVTASGMADDELLKKIDRYRMPRADVQVEVQILELNTASSSVKQDHTYRVYLNEHRDSIVEMLSAEERGRRVLMTDDAVWLHIPTASRPIRITPLQRLLGQANYGDVGRMAWHGAYRVQSLSAAPSPKRPPLTAVATLTGARFTDVSSMPVRQLVLESISPAATYPRIDVWINAADAAPVRADYFLQSGKLLKTGWFSAPEDSVQGPTVRTVAFVDEKSETAVTAMTTRSVVVKNLPASLFTVRGFVTPLR